MKKVRLREARCWGCNVFSFCFHLREPGATSSLLDVGESLAEVPDYLAPAQEQGAIMIGVTGYPGRSRKAVLLPFLP